MSSLSSSSRSLEHRGTGVVAAAALRAELDQVFQEVENKEALGVAPLQAMGKAPMVEWKITSWTMTNPNRISSKWVLEVAPFEMVQFTWHIFREWFRQFGNSQIASNSHSCTMLEHHVLSSAQSSAPGILGSYLTYTTVPHIMLML